MSGDWLAILDLALDGEQLSDADVRSLITSLEQEPGCHEAMAYLQFEAALFDHLRPKDAGVMVRSRERLLAKAVLQGKQRAVSGRAPTKRATRYRFVAVAAAAAVLVALVGWLLSPGSYPGPQARGNFRVLGAEGPPDRSSPLQRGDRLIAGDGGASVTLGGYCELGIEPGAEVTLRGEPHNEAVELHEGRVRSVIRPKRGAFAVLTPLGPVEVKGTEFDTTVEYPNHSKEGEDVMNNQTRKVLVKVAVLSGMVMCNLGDSPAILEQGASRAFAGDKPGTQGVVVATTDFTLTLKVGPNKEVTFHAPKAKRLVVREVSQLLAGDRVNVAWIEEEGKKWIQDISGHGTVEGIVTAKGEKWIEVTPKGGKPQRFIPPWRGGMPAQGGGLDRGILKKIAAAKVGDRVALRWEIPEGKRVMDVAVKHRAETSAADSPERPEKPQKGIPDELKGFLGMMRGKLVKKGDASLVFRVDQIGKVWKDNKAENPQRAVGKTITLNLKRIPAHHRERIMKHYAGLRPGDQIELEASDRGDEVLSVTEWLRKAEGKNEKLGFGQTDPPERSEKPRKGIPAGLNGFQGMMRGKLVKKGDGLLVFRVDKIMRLWKGNKAENPQGAVGQTITLNLTRIGAHHRERLMRNYRGLKEGDLIELEAFDRGDPVLSVNESLKKAGARD